MGSWILLLIWLAAALVGASVGTWLGVRLAQALERRSQPRSRRQHCDRQPCPLVKLEKDLLVNPARVEAGFRPI